MNIVTDILIVGGGPAGTSAALSFLHYSKLKVTLVEKSNLDNVKIGEHVSASILDLTDYLKIERDKVINQCTVPSFSSTSYWGSDMPSRNDSIFTTEDRSYQLDRQQFDFMLLNKVADHGGQVLPRTNCIQYVQLDNNHWKIVATHPTQGEIKIEARYLIDATGRKSQVCRQVGIESTKVDKLIGVGAFLHAEKGLDSKHSQIIESTEYGWWYTSRLPNDTITATLFTDADIVSKYKLNEPKNWNKALSKTTHLKYNISGLVSKSSKLFVRDAGSKITDCANKPNFIAIGDASVSFDPISSMGIGFAITSGCHAASHITAQLRNGESTNTAQFQKDLNKQFDQYLTTRTKYYAQEKRWLDSSFWSRRN